MSVSVHLIGIFYLSSKEAGRLSGYTSDYVSRLAREGKVAATRVGTQWFVEPKSLDGFLQNAEKAKEERKNILRDERLKERHLSGAEISAKNSTPTFISTSFTKNAVASNLGEFTNSHAHKTALLALTSGIAVACLLVLLPATPQPAVSSATLGNMSVGVTRVLSEFASASYQTFVTFFVAPATPLSDTDLSAENTHPAIQNGIVVLPPSAGSTTVAQVKDSFSDAVDVSLDATGISGTITPVFSDGKGDEYRFVMVPVAQSP